MRQATWEDLGMSRRVYLALKMINNSGDLVVSIVGVCFLIVGGKGIRRIASIWRAKLSGKSESLATDVLRISVTEGSGHVYPGKLNRPPLPSGDRRQMWDIRRMWNVGRTEFRMWDIRRRWNVGRTEFRMWEFPSGWNERCHVSQGAVCVSKGEGATRHFLGRIPQWVVVQAV